MAMAQFMVKEVYLVERTIASGHPDLDDMACEATVCASEHQAHCEAVKNMVKFALDKNCTQEEEDSLRYELVKTMRRRGISMERRYKRLKDLIIGASRAFNAEKTYYNVKRSEILAHEAVDEDRLIREALEHLGVTPDSKPGPPPGTTTCSSVKRKTRQGPRDSSSTQNRGFGRVLPPLAANQEGLARTMRAREQQTENSYGSPDEDDWSS